MEIYEAVKSNRRLQVVGLSEIVAGFINVFAGYADPLLTLVPLRNMDEYTFTHSLNVCLLNLAQATALGIEGQLLHDIGLSAMLHDVGKLFIPAEILNKPGKLDDKEWALMQQHPVRGAEYLLDNPGVPRMAVINAYEHHLRFDLRATPTSRTSGTRTSAARSPASPISTIRCAPSALIASRWGWTWCWPISSS